MLHSGGTAVPQVLSAAVDFGRLLKSFLDERGPVEGAVGTGLIDQAWKLHEGLGLFHRLLEEESRAPPPRASLAPVAERSDSLVPAIFPNTLEVQQLLQELDTVNGTIRALDEELQNLFYDVMMAAENIPLADCLGPSFPPEDCQVATSATVAPSAPEQIPSSDTLPGQVMMEGGRPGASSLQLVLEPPEEVLDAPQGPPCTALVSREAPPSRRLADAEDTAHVASLLCSPESPPADDEAVGVLQPPDASRVVSPKPPDSQQLFPVVPVEALGAQVAPWEAESIPRSRKPKVRHRNRTRNVETSKASELEAEKSAPEPEDVIESFSEDVKSQDVIQATWEQEALQDLPPPPGQPELADSTAMVPVEPARVQNSELVVYRNVIDVSDDGPLPHLAIVPLESAAQAVAQRPRPRPLTDPLGRPLKRRRPALLSQHLRSHGTSQGASGSQRLCLNLARRVARRSAWVLSQREEPSREKKKKEEPKVTPERPNVLFTGFSRSDLHQLKQSVNCLGGSAVRDLPTGRSAAETRVVVRCTTSDEGRQIAGARTIKYLDAVLAGAWVLSPDWVQESMRAGHWLAEAKFELQGDTAKMGGPAKGRHHGPELFAGFRFHFVAQARTVKKDFHGVEADGPAPHELARLAKRAGAEVLETLRKLPDAQEDPRHLADGLLSSRRKRKRSSNSAGKEPSTLPNFWWRKPILVTVPAAASKGPQGPRGLERTARLADELGWVILPSSWMLDCISGGEVCLPKEHQEHQL